MTKFKTIFTSIIGVLSAICVLLFCSNAFLPRTATSYSAGSTIRASNISDHTSTVNSLELNSTGTAREEIVKLYGTSNLSGSLLNNLVNDYFSNNGGADSTYTYDNGTGTYHWLKNNAQTLDNGSGYMSHTMTLSNDLHYALLNNALSITFTADFGSNKFDSSFGYSDEYDKVTMTLTGKDSSGNQVYSNSFDNFNGYDVPQTRITGKYFQVSNANIASFEWRFSVEFTPQGSLGLRSTSNSMIIINPTIMLTSSDLNAPEITYSIDNENNWAQSKDVKITINDPAGVSAATINGEPLALSFNDNHTQATATITATPSANVFNIVSTDCVGNSSEQTTINVTKLDNMAPEISVDIADNTVLDSFDIDFVATFDPNFLETVAPETYTYTLTYEGEVEGEHMALINGQNHLISARNGNCVLSIYATDEAGNINKITRNITINAQYYYEISTTLTGIAQSSSVVLEGDVSQLNTQVSYTISPTIEQNGHTYTLYRVVKNGQDVGTELNNIDFTFTSTTVYNLIYREVVEMTLNKSNYDYTGGPITLDYTTNLPSVNWTITKNGEPAEIREAGEYEISFSIDDENYIGSASYKISVQIPVNLSINTTSYTYSPDGFTFDYELTGNADFTLTFTNESGSTFTPSDVEINSLDVGKYTYKITLNTPYAYFTSLGYGVQEASGEFTISPREISLGSFSDTVEYNGATYEFTEDYGYDVVVKYFQNDIEVTSPKDAGEYVVTITIDETNYTGSITGTLTITPREVILTAQDATSVYGEAFSGLNYSQNGFLEGEEVEFELTCDYENKANEYVIDFVRKDVKNYSITYNTATYTVTPRELVVTILENQGKTFGEADTEIKYTLSGNLSTDEVTVTLTREEGNDVGEYAIKVASISNPNYVVTLDGDPYYYITAMNVILRANDQTITYGDDLPNFSEEVSKFYTVLYGEPQADLEITLSTTATAGADAGQYAITITCGNTKNYQVTTIPGILTIKKADLNVEILDASKAYGEADPELKYNAGVVLMGAPSREAGEAVGTYTITLGTLSHKNYNLTPTNGTFTINKAPVTITANNVSSVYSEGDAELTFTTDIAVDLTKFTGTLVRESGTDAGEYAISLGTLNSDCYEITFTPGTYTITKRVAVVTFSNVSKTYGTADPEFIYKVSGVLNGEEINVVVSRAEGENVGEYTITATTDSKNYTLNVLPATLNITKANAVISVNDRTFTYDGSSKDVRATLNIDGELTYRYVLDSETVAEIKDAGEYSVTISFAGNENFNPASKTVSVTVYKADANVTFIKNIFVENGSMQLPVIESELEYTLSWDDITIVSNVGVHGYTIVFTDPNYNSIRGELTILARPSNTTEGGSVEFESGDVDNENIDLSIEKTEDNKTAQDATNMTVDSTYEIKYNQSSNATIKVAIDYITDNYNDVYVYAYNENGEAKRLDYQVVDGKLVFSVDADNLKFAIVKQVTGISIVTIGAFVILAGLIALAVVRHHTKKKKKTLLKIS